LNQGLLWLHLDLPSIVHFVVLIAAVLAGTIAIASLTYQFIELPGQALGRIIISKLEKRTDNSD